METNFKGWVPTVTTRLWFGAVGIVSQPDAVSENVDDDTDLFVVCYQKRDTLDSILPWKNFWAQRMGVHGARWFVCLGRTRAAQGQNHEILAGRLLIFHDNEDWRHAHSIIKRLRKLLRCYRRELPDVTLSAYAGDSMVRAQDELQPLSSFHVAFELARSGEVNFVHDDTLPTSQNAPQRPSYMPHEQALHLVAAQLFYFLRDISHRHQHHHPQTDTIVDLHVVVNDDIRWRVSTLESLYRKIIKFKRVRSQESILAAIGVLAYAQAFYRLCCRDRQTFTAYCPTYDDVALESSLRAAHDEICVTQAVVSEGRARVVNGGLAAAGVLFALLALVSLTGTTIGVQPSPIILELARSVVKDTYLWCLAVAAIVIMPSAIPRTRRLWRFLVRALQRYNRYAAAGMCIVLAALLFYLMWKGV